MNEEEASKAIAVQLEEASKALNEAMRLSKESGVPFNWSPAETINTGYGYFEEYESYTGKDSLKDYAREEAIEKIEELGPDYESSYDWDSHKYVAKAEDFEEKLKEFEAHILKELEWEPETTTGKLSFNPETGFEMTNYWLPSSAFC